VRKSLIMLGIFALIAPLLFLGCEGDDGAQGPAGPAGDNGTTTVVFAPADQPETCVVCHSETGTDLHALYQELYQNGVIEVTNLQTTYNGPNQYITTFNMTKNGAPFDCRDADTLGIYIVEYTGSAFEMPDANGDGEADRLSLQPSISATNPNAAYQGTTAKAYDGLGGCTVTATYNDNVVDYTTANSLVVLYGADEQVGSLPARIRQVKFPFEGLYETQGPGAITYVSGANNAGCERCHTIPYLKHGYIYGQLAGDPTTDFYACKACHLDNGEGGHFEWQMSVNDPPLWASGNATPAQEAQYAYKTRLMNDVHMSHAMEFPYPQSMSNCIVCHEGKLDLILTDANFSLTTCKSCHPVTGSTIYTGGMSGTEPYQEAEPGSTTNAPTVELALQTIIPHGFDDTTVCTNCHFDGGIAPAFKTIHTGYYKNVIYYVDPATGVGTKYSSAITVAIDNASFDNNLLTIQFSATGALGGLDSANITPTLMVGLYGWDTKDFIVGPHARDIDNDRNLEYVVGATHPRFTTVTNAGGVWEVVADLSDWSALIASDNVTKVEIGVIPALQNPALGAGDNTVSLNAPSRTFSLATNAFVNNYYQGTNALVRVSTGCNECHEALSTTFHTSNRGRGGNIVVCRLCHITLSGGSHLEMQSRSIDSYAHAIHSMQPFDINNIDFNDDVYAKHYEEHIEFPYPKHGITDCESCHNPGKYNAPSQYQSLPGLLSASESHATLAANGYDRNIGDIPEYVTGPGVRACGACHRAHEINEDNAGELDILFSHWKQLGYMYENDADDTVLYDTIYGIMGLFGNP